MEPARKYYTIVEQNRRLFPLHMTYFEKKQLVQVIIEIFGEHVIIFKIIFKNRT